MPQEKHIFKVSELTKNIKRILETSFGHLWVEGEISNVRQPSSGHLYFTLKDERSQMRCVLFRQQSQGLRFRLQDGMQIVVFARLSVYERDGTYQLYVEIVEPRGKGSFQLAFEQLKARLLGEGLFDAEHKKPIPFLPTAIGIITSPTGAVIRDMLHVLEKRFDTCCVVLYPVKVQGEGAKNEIVAALTHFNAKQNVDVIILARGGGSIEDLWAFNEEDVVRAIFHSTIPVLSAIGHETDFTIADFVSDVRASTPSRAAELVVPNKGDLFLEVQSLMDDLNGALRDFIPEQQQRIDDLMDSLQRSMESLAKDKRSEFELQISKLQTLNPLRTLSRGYSITRTEARRVALKDVGNLRIGECVMTQLHKGTFSSVVKEINYEV